LVSSVPSGAEYRTFNIQESIVELGIIKPVNDRVYPFEQIIEAHKYVEMGHKKGNVAITVNKKT
jgi:NADPH:quinone reductase-like Zn-dependent oxidoreductase